MNDEATLYNPFNPIPRKHPASFLHIDPSPPARPLYLVSQGRPERKVVLEFIKWILTDGQKYVSEASYINLTEEKIAEEQGKLESDQ